MNKQYIIFPAVITVIIIIIISFALSKQIPTISEDELKPITIENQTHLKIVNTNMSENNIDKQLSEQEINSTLNKIKQKAENNTYTPAQREWITSGPLQIDRTKYILGEKVFMRFGGIEPSEKGQIVFLRPLNDTHYSVYLSIPFDGVSKNAFNLYFEPKLSKINNICSKDDLLGKWAVVLRGTDYPNLYFDVIDQILPGDEEKFTPVC